jgi:hypothetical protein
LTIPVHLAFNSHRESSSPALGKGWIVPLLESRVEPDGRRVTIAALCE